jgi:hypothetical protein
LDGEKFARDKVAKKIGGIVLIGAELVISAG